MLKRASQTNPRDARLAEMQRRIPQETRKCLLQPVLAAAERQEFLLSPVMTDLYIAANVSQSRRVNNFAHIIGL